MGLIRLTLPASKRIAMDWIHLAYMAGLDGVPASAEITLVDEELHIVREVDSSGKIYLPIHDEQQGILLVPTGTIVERATPYRVLVELARGSLDRLRNQHDLWIRCGFSFSESLANRILETTRAFCNAVVDTNPESSSQLASQVLTDALKLIAELSKEYNRAVIALRLSQTGKLTTLFGTVRTLNPKSSSVSPQANDDRFCAELSNSVNIPIFWRELEPTEDSFQFEEMKQLIAFWKTQQKRILLGPIIRIDERYVPDYILDSDRFEHVRQRLGIFVSKVIAEFAESVDVVQVFGGLNSVDDLNLPADYRLRLAIDSIEAARAADQTTPMIIGFDQPWSEASEAQNSLSPLQCADAVVRANLNLSGFLLEMNWGIAPSGASPRDYLQVHTLFDLWSQFDLPIFVRMGIPSSPQEDSNAFRNDPVVPLGEDSNGMTRQSEIAVELSELILAKPIVQGLFWAQLSDATLHRFRNLGLLDGKGEPKPCLEKLLELRHAYLS